MSSSMIYSGIPGSSNPHAHGIGISIGGLFEQWSPLRLTNYAIEATGTGTVQVLGSSSLVNSTLEMDGPGSNLLNEGLMTLQNSQLDINGSISGSGMILATGGSTVTVDYSTPIKDTYQQPLTRQQSSDLASARPELISLKSSTLNITSSTTATNYAGPVIMDGKSTANIDGGPFNVGAKNFGIYATGPQLGTVNLTTDVPVHITGIMQVDANLNINGRSPVDIDGGRLILGGASAGNTIAITSGTLEFAQTPGFLQSPETASEGFNTKLAFTGNSGAVQFDGAPISSIILEHATPTSPIINQIAIFSQGHPIAALDLAPSAQAYSASEFSVHGNTLFFHHS
jgi:hypothetical protein